MWLSLLILFAFKHWLADREWQAVWMVEGKRKAGWAFVPPLAAHAGLHAGLTLLVLWSVSTLPPYVGLWSMILLSGFDFLMHFGMDRIKGVATRPYSEWGYGEPDKFRSPLTIKIWTLVDQAVHAMTYLVIIYLLTG